MSGHVDHHAALFVLLNARERHFELWTALAALRTKNIAGQAARMHAHQRIAPVRRIADQQHAVDRHRRCQRRERRLTVLGPQLVGDFLDFAELGAPHAGVPVDFDFAVAEPERQRNWAEHADAGTARRAAIGRDLNAVAVNLEQFAVRFQALAHGRIEVGEHRARLCVNLALHAIDTC